MALTSKGVYATFSINDSAIQISAIILSVSMLKVVAPQWLTSLRWIM